MAKRSLDIENAGTPYTILLGLLGRDVYAAEGDRNIVQLSISDMERGRAGRLERRPAAS